MASERLRLRTGDYLPQKSRERTLLPYTTAENRPILIALTNTGGLGEIPFLIRVHRPRL